MYFTENNISAKKVMLFKHTINPRKPALFLVFIGVVSIFNFPMYSIKLSALIFISFKFSVFKFYIFRLLKSVFEYTFFVRMFLELSRSNISLITLFNKIRTKFLTSMKLIISDVFLLAKHESGNKNDVTCQVFEKIEVKHAKKAILVIFKALY